MNTSLDEQFVRFINLVHHTLLTTMLHLDCSLRPSEFPMGEGTPPPVKSAWEQILFSGLLFYCLPDRIHEIDSGLGICFSALALRGQDGFLVLGPYIPSESGRALLTGKKMPQDDDILWRYCRRLPALSHKQIHAVLSLMEFELYGDDLPEHFECIEAVGDGGQACPVLEEDINWVRSNVLSERYAAENKMLDMVMRGELLTDIQFSTPVITRSADTLREQKNRLIILNTILRKNLERVKIHPYFIDQISSKWARKIESLTFPSVLQEMIREIINDYALLVRRHTQVNYSHNVRALIDYMNIHFADSNLTLKRAAKELGVNASYLSQQFNRETGQHLPEYLSELRIEKAKRLLQDFPELTVGQVAAAAGYSDANYFSRVFRRSTGQTPIEFRKCSLDVSVQTPPLD